MGAAGVPQGELIHVELDPAPMLVAYATHRRRLATAALDLDAAQLASPSRCARWSVADVLRHLCDVDSWMTAIWAGGQPPFDAFDPRSTPDEHVAAGRSVADTAVPDRYADSTAAFLEGIDPADVDRWSTTSVSPLGLVPWWQSALHLFWDSWLHERDALLPAGATPTTEPDEVLAALLYGLALSGTMCARPIDAEVAGAHLRTGQGPPRATPGATGVRADAATAGVVDALAGRGELAEAVADVDESVLAEVGRLARFLRG